jgi:hypothetical protein
MEKYVQLIGNLVMIQSNQIKIKSLNSSAKQLTRKLKQVQSLKHQQLKEKMNYYQMKFKNQIGKRNTLNLFLSIKTMLLNIG